DDPALDLRVRVVSPKLVLPRRLVRWGREYPGGSSLARGNPVPCLLRIILPLLAGMSVCAWRRWVARRYAGADGWRRRGKTAGSRPFQSRAKVVLLGNGDHADRHVGERLGDLGCIFFPLHHDRPEAHYGPRPLGRRGAGGLRRDYPRIHGDLGAWDAAGHDPRLRHRRLGLEAPSQVAA